MKLALILGLVAVAFASSQWEQRPELIREQSFRSGQHYTFHFDGQVSSGLPLPTSSQQSSTRIQSIVSLVFQNEKTALLKLQKIRVGSAHRDLVEPRDLQPFALFQENELTNEQKEKLSLPLRFRYEHGLISEVEFDSEDQAWSENIKRSILNMLQVNLSKKTRTDVSEMSRIIRESNDETEFPEKDYFTTQELTLEGDCETAYTVVPSGQEKLRVSKSINFEKCNKRVDMRYNLRFDEECPSCEKKFNGEERNSESSTVINFELNGKTEDFLIREVELRSQYLFSPLSKEQHHMASFVVNRLVLVKVDESVDRVSTPKTEKKSTIVYSTEWEEALERFVMDGEEEILREISYPWIEKKMEIARSIIEQIRRTLKTAEEKNEKFRPEVNHEVARLVEVLRVFTKEEIKTISREMNKEEEMKSIFFDILAIVGTKNSIEYLNEKIVEKEITPLKASRLLKEIMNLRVPSDKIIHSLIRLCKEDVSERNPILKQTCWLTVGSLMNGLCAENRNRLAKEVSFEKENKKNSAVCPRVQKEKYVQEMERLFQKASTRYEKVLALKTMANSGLDLIVFPLEKIIKESREERIVRLQAIESLRKLRSQMPRKIHSILLPIFKNMKEYPEVRIAAFHQIMHTLPERVVIDQITQQLEREPSRQVATFVYSSLKSLAKSDIPCEQELSRNIEQSLRLARVQPRKTWDSQHIRSSFYDNEYFTGASINWAHLFTNDSVIPKEVMASIDTVFAGQWNKYLAQVGFSQQNIDQILYKLVQKLQDKESMDEVIVRGKRSNSQMKPAEVLRKLMTKMGIQKRRYSNEEAHAMIYLRYKDMDYAVIPFEEEMISSIMKDTLRGDKLNLGHIERVLSQGLRFNTQISSFIYETSRIIPTTLGLPLEITGKMPTVVSIDGEFKTEMEPKNGESLDGLRMHLKAHPKISSTHITHMEIRSPILSTGVKIMHSVYVNLPVDLSLQLKWNNNADIKLTVRVPEFDDQHRVLSLNTRPVTYIRYENVPKKMESSVEKTVFIAQEPMTEVNDVYGEKAFGIRFLVSGNVHRHLTHKMQQGRVLPLIVCENNVEVVVEKKEDTPREYVFNLNVETFKKTQSELPEFDSFYEKDSQKHFEVEDSEYVKEKEDERRGEFSSYYKNYKTQSRDQFSHRLTLKAQTLGSSVERRAEMEIKTVCDDSLTFCKWNIQSTRSPLFSTERRDWTLSASIQTLFPESIVSLKQLHEQKHRELSVIVNAKWGSEEKNVLKMRLQGEQSKEQQKWQSLTVRKSDQQQMSTIESLEKLELASRLNQIKMVVDYEMLPETLVQLSRLSALLKSWKPLSVSVEPLRLQKAYERNGQMLLKLTVEPQTWRYVNVSVETPSERLVLENIRLPFRPTWLSIQENQPIRKLRESTRLFSTESKCEVSSSRVNTFDEVVYRTPLTTCYSVLAKDCSESKFVVLMKNVEKNGEEKKMKIVTEESEVEVEMKNERLVVKLNGKEIKEDKQTEDIQIKQKRDVVIISNDDIFVRFDGFKAEIKISEEYKNKQCGLCGHYDGEYEGEFRRADNEETEDIEEFHRSFLNKDDECEMEEEKLSKKENYKRMEKKNMKVEDEEYDSEEEKKEFDFELSPFEEKRFQKKSLKQIDEEETVEPEEKTKVIETSSRICFSKTPVRECPRNSHDSIETEELKVKFSCLERNSVEARRLLRESRNEIVSVENLPHSFVETIRVPKTCVVY